MPFVTSRLFLLGAALLALPAFAQSSVHLPVGADRAAGAMPSGEAATPIVRPADVPAIVGGYTEGFDSVSSLPDVGWAFQNNSDPIGTASWFGGNPEVFPARSGADSTYLGVNFNSTAGTGFIYNWALTPPLAIQNGTTLTFWTRTVTPGATVFPDRLQVRLSTNGASTDVGTLAGEEGDFTTLLLDINETYSTTGYPSEWTEFSVTVTDLAAPTTGRFAFLYVVEDGGPAGNNSNFIGIDDLSTTAGIVANEGAPSAGTLALTAAPNPVTHAATLSFSLAETSEATLTVVDALGRTVATLADGSYVAGTHTATWDVGDAAPGVYVVRLVSGTEVAVRRLVVTR